VRDTDFIAFVAILIIIILLALFYEPSYPAEKSMLVGLYTYHFTDGDYEEGVDNHLVGLEYDNWSSAFFRNSHGKETIFTGYGFHTDKYYNERWWVRGNIYAGLLAGYGEDAFIHYGIFSPGVYPTFNIGYENCSLETGLMPGFVWWGLRVEF